MDRIVKLDDNYIDDLYAYHPKDEELIEVWFVTKCNEKFADFCGNPNEIEIEAFRMTSSNVNFVQFKKWYENYMLEIEKRQKKREDESDYKKYLELKAKFEKE